VAAQQRPQQRPIALGGAAVGQRPRDRRLFGDVGPALGGCRLPDQGLQPGAEHGHLREASEQALVFEPPEPAAGGVDLSGTVGGHRHAPDQPRDPVAVPGGLGVVDRGFR